MYLKDVQNIPSICCATPIHKISNAYSSNKKIKPANFEHMVHANNSASIYED